MKKTKLLNVYRCTLVSDKDIRYIKVIANSYGQAAKLCCDSISFWDNRESYELVSIQFLDICFVYNSL